MTVKSMYLICIKERGYFIEKSVTIVVIWIEYHNH